jgi:hypothetical protein
MQNHVEVLPSQGCDVLFIKNKHGASAGSYDKPARSSGGINKGNSRKSHILGTSEKRTFFLIKQVCFCFALIGYDSEKVRLTTHVGQLPYCCFIGTGSVWG